MDEIKNILFKLAIGKGISDSDVKRLVFGKNAEVIKKISKHLDQTVDLSKAIISNPKIVQEVIKSKAITEIFKYSKKKG